MTKSDIPVEVLRPFNKKDKEEGGKKIMKDIQDVIAYVGDTSARRQLREWVKTYDLEKVESFKDIAAGYKGVLLICLHLGHDDKGIRQMCETMIKCLNGYAQAYERHLALEFPLEIKKQIQKEIAQLVEALERVLPEDQFLKIKNVIDSMGTT